MDRTQKKCVVASTGVHLLLALILFIGPAFGSSKNKIDDLPLLDFVPVKTVDALISGGGYRDGSLPAAAPIVQQPPPKPEQPPPAPPEKKKEPDPPKDVPKETLQPKEDPASLVPSKQAKRKPDVSTDLITRKKDPSEAKAKADAKAREEAKAQAESRRQLAREIGKAADRIGEEVGGTTSIKLLGPGGGGVPYANFLAAVKSAYEREWVVPDGIEDDQSVVVVSVTIAKDGHVVRSYIVDRSGNALVDNSVQATLNRVKYAAPLPDDATQSERTVKINFSVKAKQGLG
jgi:colicin import membrane protein